MLRSAARRWIYPSASATCAIAHRLAWRRYVRRNPPRPWHSADAPVVIIAPHPDDETVGAGGAALLHRAAGDSVTILLVTDGGASRAVPDIVRVRRREAMAAADRLGARLVSLELPEGDWSVEAGAEAIAPRIAGASHFYAPSIVDFHPEHRRVANALARVVPPEATVRVVELGVPLSPLLVNVVADIASVAEEKRLILSHYVSQRRALDPLERLARYRAGLYGLRHAEVFWEMSGAAYRSLAMAGAPTFRGVRSRPFLDPVTLGSGLRARARLQKRTRRAPRPGPSRSPDARHP